MKDVLKQNFAGVLTAIFIFLLPFIDYSSFLFYGALNAKYFFIVGFVTILGLYYSYLVIGGRHQISLKGRTLLGVLLGVLVLHYISAFLGVDPERSLWSDILRSSGLLFITGVSLVAFFVSELVDKRGWNMIFNSIVLSSTVLALWSFFSPSLNLSFGNSTFAGSYILLGFIITLIQLFKSETGSVLRKSFSVFALVQLFSPLFIKWSVLISPAILLQNPTSILGSARASGATAILVVLFLIGVLLINNYFKTNTKKVLASWFVVFGLVVFGSIALLFTPGSFVQEKYIENSTAARVIVWENGLEAFKERPLFGWGPENFRFAQERYFDSNLYLDKNIGEVWFDKSHNVFVEKLVTVGLVGTLTTAFALFYLCKTIYSARRKNDISETEAILLSSLFFFHLIQLQTAFDTPATYVLLSVVIGYILWFEKNNFEQKETTLSNKQKFIGVVLVLVILFGTYQMFFQELSRQYSLAKVFAAETSEEQLKYIDRVLDGERDFESLRLMSSSFIKGTLEQLEGATSNSASAILENARPQIDAYDRYYSEYLLVKPDDYRARMNYSYLLFAKTFFGENSLEKAKTIIQDSYELSPGNPLTPIMDGLASFYGGNLGIARTKINEAIAINPEIEFSNEVSDYLDRQAARIPNISLIRLGNI